MDNYLVDKLHLLFFIMYRYSLKSPLMVMLKGLTYSIVSAVILSLLLISLQKVITDFTIITRFTIKATLSLVFSLIFVQITKQYDVISKIKQMKHKYDWNKKIKNF